MRLLPSLFRSPLAIVLALAGAGCTRSYAAAPRPDLAGVWDIVYDDYVDAELRTADGVQRMRVAREGGRLVAKGPRGTIVLAIDCAREDLICPHEVWPAELTLSNRIGDLDDEGEHLTVSLAGEGRGACVLGEDSALAATVVSLGSAREGAWQATALSQGHVTTVVSGRCLGASGDEARVQIALSSGVSAVRR